MPITMHTAEVARAFGLGSPVRDLTHVARGAMGEVFRLDTERGSFAVKRLLWGPTGNEEANAALQFAAAGAGVPLPQPLLTTNGDILKRLGDGWWRAYEWVDGAPGQGADPVQIAAALGRLHALGYDAGSIVDEWYCGSLGHHRINAAVDTASRHGFDLEHHRALLLAFDDVVAMAPPGPVVGCHNDADKKNVLVAAGRAVLIDWDNAGPSVGAREFGGAIAHWGNDDAATISAMTRAYRDVGGVFAPDGLSVFAHEFSQSVHYIVKCLEDLDSDAPGSDGERAFQRPFLEHLATTTLTIERYERILELVPS